MSQSFDSRQFRTALGRYATGVTVITTLSQQGEQIGLTVNSFSSLSLDPPLVLWSVDRDSDSFDTFMQCDGFTVNVLAEDQIGLSTRFSRRNVDRFDGTEIIEGALPYPLISGCTAHFECRLYDRFEGGDHVILIGRVESFRSCNRPPLLFIGGRYWKGPKPADQ